MLVIASIDEDLPPPEKKGNKMITIRFVVFIDTGIDIDIHFCINSIDTNSV